MFNPFHSGGFVPAVPVPPNTGLKESLSIIAKRKHYVYVHITFLPHGDRHKILDHEAGSDQQQKSGGGGGGGNPCQ